MLLMSNRSDCFNLNELKSRGWTSAKISLWLKEPDMQIRNPVYKTGSPSKLYLKKRVKTQEKNKRFKQWMESSKHKREKISVKQKSIANTKREELIKHIDSISIVIERIPLDELKAQAVEHYNLLWESRGRFDKKASIHDDKIFINRICVNMLRHKNDHYEEELCQMFGKVGVSDAYVYLKNRINSLILEAYPELEDQPLSDQDEKLAKEKTC